MWPLYVTWGMLGFLGFVLAFDTSKLERTRTTITRIIVGALLMALAAILAFLTWWST